MSVYSKVLRYNLGNTTKDIKLYTSISDVGERYITIRDNGNNVYAPLLDSNSSLASNIKVRLNNTDYAVGYRIVDPTPGLLLERTRAGTHTTYYNVGDTFNIVLNGKVTDYLSFNNETYQAVIIGFDHNKKLETGGAYSTHLAICKKSGSTGNIAFVEDTSSAVQITDGSNRLAHNLTQASNRGGWSTSVIRLRWLNVEFLACMPPEWVDVMGATTKYTDNMGNSNVEGSVTDTTDRMFLMSEYELYGTRSYANTYEQNYQAQYTYFATSSNRKFYRHDTGKGCSCNFRSPYYNNASDFCLFLIYNSYKSWKKEHAAANYTRPIVPCFAVF